MEEGGLEEVGGGVELAGGASVELQVDTQVSKAIANAQKRGTRTCRMSRHRCRCHRQYLKEREKVDEQTVASHRGTGALAEQKNLPDTARASCFLTCCHRCSKESG